MKTFGIIPLADNKCAIASRDLDKEGKPKPNHLQFGHRRLKCPLAIELMETTGFELQTHADLPYKALTCLLFNISRSMALSGGKPLPLIVSRRSANYTGTGISYDAMMAVIDALDVLDLVTWEKGDWQAGKASELLPTPELVKLLSSRQGVEVEVDKAPDLIVLKDKDGNRLPVPNTAAVRKMRKNLEIINASSGQFTWSFEFEGTVYEMLPSDLAQRRSFNNGSFALGGRFYSAANGLPERKLHLRSKLMVDGRPTVELDFKSMQPRMLYHMEGLPAPEDCYDIVVPGLEKADRARDIIKTALLIALNCRKEQGPTNALREALKREKLWLPGEMEAPELLAAVQAAHPLIAKYFCSGIGLSLQFRDAQIAEFVLLVFAHENKPCLPIHDSFVVAADDEEFADDTMRIAYFAEMGDWPKIKKKSPDAESPNKLITLAAWRNPKAAG